MSTNNRLPANPDFSLVLGGPLFQLFRRAHLTGDALEMSNRRVMIVAGITWVPLLLLSLASGRAFGDAGGDSRSSTTWKRTFAFLIALPLLIAAELIVHRRLLPAVRQFVERRIVIPEELPKFQQAIESDRAAAQLGVDRIGLIALVYGVGIWIWRTRSRSTPQAGTRFRTATARA